MLEQIVAALRARTDLSDWSVRRVTTRGAQLYAVPQTEIDPRGTRVEARRQIRNERYVVEVFRQTTGLDGTPQAGSGNVTLLPGDPIERALDDAALRAGLVHNQPYGLPSPAPLPTVALADPALQDGAEATLNELLARLRMAVGQQPNVRLTAAEFFGDEETTQLCNSRGIDATQTSTRLHLEYVLLCRDGERETEAFAEITRRRVQDLPIEEEGAQRAQYALDTLRATSVSAYTGPVVLQGETLAVFLNSSVLRTLTSAAAKYGKATTWEIGQSVFRGAVYGDPLTVYANRQLPFGTHANQFDDEGLPAQRVPLIENNVLTTFIADQRYAEYLSIAPTGAFGDIEVPPGPTPRAELLRAPHVEVVSFSWFNPDAITGEFASEIRLGYLVEGGQRTPFKGGVLVGNVLDALANVRWSAETGFHGDYQGPTTARFAQLTIAGEGANQ